MHPFTIVYFSATANELPSLSRALALWPETDGPLRVIARTQTQLFDASRVADFVEAAMRADCVVLSLHGGQQCCPAFTPLIAARNERRAQGLPVPYLHIQPVGGDEDALQLAHEHADGQDTGNWQRLFRYFSFGGVENYRKALHCLPAICRGSEIELPDAQPVPLEGIYHPDLGLVSDGDAYYRTYLDPDKPTVGLWFFQHNWINQNLAHIDALIRAIEARGANVLAVFSMRLKDANLNNRGADEIMHSYFMAGGEPRIDVLLNVMSMSMTLTNTAYQELYPELGVTVLQAMTCSLPYAVWKERAQGVSVMDVTYQAAQPEFDGNLIIVPVATREEDSIDPLTGALLSRFAPIPDRVDHWVSLALNWAKLRHLNNADKRIAILPPLPTAQRPDWLCCRIGQLRQREILAGCHGRGRISKSITGMRTAMSWPTRCCNA